MATDENPAGTPPDGEIPLTSTPANDAEDPRTSHPPGRSPGPPAPAEATTLRTAPPAVTDSALNRVAREIAHDALAHPDIDGPPQSIGPWKILRPLGEGGFGIVYHAERSNPAQQAAIKLIKPGMDSRAVLARFDAERQALALLTHPNIARLYDAGVFDGRPYFAMEFVPGLPITDFCQRHKLDLTARLKLFQQVCQAVQHAHLKAIIHRDISARNVLVTEIDGAPTAKVIDFGIAKAVGLELTDKTIDTGVGNIIGNYAYMSPEQAAGDPDIDARTDVYSLGVLLYELLTGERPFDNATIQKAGDFGIRKLIVETDPPRPSDRTTTVEMTAILRRELEWIPLKALRKDRTRRYQTPSDFADDIQNYLDNKPLSAGPESRVYQLRKFSTRNRVPIVATAAVLSFSIAGTAFYVRNIRAEQARTAAALALVSTEAAEKERQRAEAAKQRDEAARQRDEAQKQTAIASAVAEFQTDMLSTADPSKLLGDKVTVLQAVSAAIKELDAGKLKDRPLVEASVRFAIGRTLRSLARHADADPNLRRALELRRANLPESDPGLRAALHEVATNLVNVNNLAAAEPLLLEAVELAKKSSFVDPVGYGRSLNQLGDFRYHQNRVKESEDLFRQSLALGRLTLAPDDPLLAVRLSNLGFVLAAQSRLAEAEPLHKEALAVRRKMLPPGHPDTAESLYKLARLLEDLGRPAEAEPLFRESVAISRKAYPEFHPSTGVALTCLANFLQGQKRLAEAEPLYREVLAIYQKALPSEHPFTASALANLGSIRQSLRELPQAEADLRQALSLLHRIHPTGHPDIATATQILADILWDQKKLPEAEQLFRDAIAINRRLLPKDHLSTASVIYDLGVLLDTQGRSLEAEPLFREALDMRRRLLPPDHPQVTKARNNLASVLSFQTTRPEALTEAEALYRETLAIFQKSLPPSHPDTGATLYRIALILKAKDLPAEALPLFEQALTIRTTALGPTNTHTCRAAFYLAQTLDTLNRPEEATALRTQYRLGDPATRPSTQPTTRPATAPAPSTRP